MDDEIESPVSSDYDNPYTETAANWYNRHSQRVARRRNGLDSSSDESLDEELNTAAGDAGDVLFDRWMGTFPIVAARCSLFIKSCSGRRSVRDQEVKVLRRIIGKSAMHCEQKDDERNGTSSDDAKYHQLVANSMIPNGLGIKFVDAVLFGKANREPFISNGHSSEQRRFCQTVLELCGPARTGMTSILITSAARYVANTSNLFLQAQDFNNKTPNEHSNEQFTSPNTDINESSSGPNKRQRLLHLTNNNIPEPQVVILDVDHRVHTLKLILSVREAVLRRWEETSLGRKWRMQQQCVHRSKEANVTDGNHNCHECTCEIDNNIELLQIEKAISSCLGRIHIVQPRDFTHLSLVATIESLIKKLHADKLIYERTHSTVNSSIQQPPLLLIIDSLSTLDACARAQESLPTASGSVGGSGLSERNAFYRQLARLREEHEVAMMASCRNMNASDGEYTSNIWDKMVTDKINIHHVAEGTDEQRKGFEFVATFKNQHGNGSNVYPYSVTTCGIYS